MGAKCKNARSERGNNGKAEGGCAKRWRWLLSFLAPPVDERTRREWEMGNGAGAAAALFYIYISSPFSIHLLFCFPCFFQWREKKKKKKQNCWRRRLLLMLLGDVVAATVGPTRHSRQAVHGPGGDGDAAGPTHLVWYGIGVFVGNSGLVFIYI